MAAVLCSISAHRRRGGWTLLELLVVIAVLGLLAALLMSALSSSRRAVGDVGCLARLMQLGVACGSYHSAHGLLPPGHFGGVHSFPAHLLPYLEQAEAYERVNFSLTQSGAEENRTVATLRLACFVCPETATFRREAGAVMFEGFGIAAAECTYAGSWGSPRRDYFRDDGAFGHQEGLCVRTKEITDGLSRTAMLSERDWRDASEALRTGIGAANQVALPVAYSDAEYFAECLDNSIRPKVWLIPQGWLNAPFYDHALPPNRSGCTGDGTTVADVNSTPASSRHVGHVNLCFADGNVIAVADSVDRYVWRLLGGRDNGVPSEGSF